MKVDIAGTWKAVSKIKVNVGGTWRRVSRIKTNVGGTWKAAGTYVLPLTLSADPPVVGEGEAGGVVAIDYSGVVPSGGLSPFTYAWTALSSGGISISDPVIATTSFYKLMPFPSTASGTFRCTVTDALGSTAFADITVTLRAS